jgi:hypothetical protein
LVCGFVECEHFAGTSHVPVRALVARITFEARNRVGQSVNTSAIVFEAAAHGSQTVSTVALSLLRKSHGILSTRTTKSETVQFLAIQDKLEPSVICSNNVQILASQRCGHRLVELGLFAKRKNYVPLGTFKRTPNDTVCFNADKI